jgi:hypothetical protein
MTPEEERIRAEQAQRLLNDPLMAGALQDIKDTLIDDWRRTPVKDQELRERIWGIYVAAFKFEELLRSYIGTGKFAERVLQQEEQARTMFRRAMGKFMP